ncbi:galactose mutarotase [Kiritimatiellota bacterium B12222]|nr:galactose mutarotase [Kiritimatiellota bacterium B12222]
MKKLCLHIGRLLLGGLLTACASTQTPAPQTVQQYRIKNEAGTIIDVTNYGATIMSIITADRNGEFADIVLGYTDPSRYKSDPYNPNMGATIGRFGNRIAYGKFSIGDTSYNLAVNNGSHHLHGGRLGFDKVIWDVHAIEKNALTFSYLSKDGEEGYPGNISVSVTYTLTEANELIIEYVATTDQTTPLNLTNHTYFNLKGEGEGTILDHELMINATTMTPVNEILIPTGEIVPVAETPFDFTRPKKIGQDIYLKNEQLEYGYGYDHNFVLTKDSHEEHLTLAATVYEPSSGRYLEVHTEEPGLQFYTANFLRGEITGKSGKPYLYRGGFCLETQHFPDSPNQPTFPNTLLQPGEEYRSTTIYTFSVR